MNLSEKENNFGIFLVIDEIICLFGFLNYVCNFFLILIVCILVIVCVRIIFYWLISFMIKVICFNYGLVVWMVIVDFYFFGYGVGVFLFKVIEILKFFRLYVSKGVLCGWF